MTIILSAFNDLLLSKPIAVTEDTGPEYKAAVLPRLNFSMRFLTDKDIEDLTAKVAYLTFVFNGRYLIVDNSRLPVYELNFSVEE